METNMITIQDAVQIAGLAQIVLVVGSLGVPGVLQFNVELAKVQTLIKQMFWTYAGYILVTNLCFGFVSLFASSELLNGSVLAGFVTGFIAAYWISRVLVQFFYFDRLSFPKGKWHKLAEVTLVTLFISLSIIYSYAFYVNFKQI
ncbi:hypothetical protein ACFQZI_00665 [Mucilaginibacter lutimaris]|uniref:Uncharacterized protein n=1 Tax=Mucilaginibacter lutimaris TaxID=931629 RepID=A0ABW2Z950_9SPHI